LVLAALLILSGVLFGIATTIERGEKDEHAASEGGESHEHAEGTSEEGEAHFEEPSPHDEESDESILGVDIESPLFVGLGVALTVVLAALVWLRPERGILWAVALFAVTFALLDLRELLHQVDEERTRLATLAGVIAAIHVSVAVLAVRSSSRVASAGH
jgi:hypothetical protein